MKREGHLGAALAAYAPVAFVTTALGLADLTLFGGAAIVALAMLPDIDLQLPLVPHRGPTHTVWFALIVAGAGGYVGWTIGTDDPLTAIGLAGFSATVGGLAIGSHVAADALTPMGVRPFAPVSDRRYTFDLTTAANPIANLLGLVFGVGLAVGAVFLGELVAGM